MVIMIIIFIHIQVFVIVTERDSVQPNLVSKDTDKYYENKNDNNHKKRGSKTVVQSCRESEQNEQNKNV